MTKGKYIRTNETIKKQSDSKKKFRQEVYCKRCDIRVENVGTARKYCGKCIKDIAREKRNSWKKDNSNKNAIQHKIYNEIRRKRLIHPSKLICAECGSKASEYHHPDYTKPFFVIPLCHSCHMKIHQSKSKEKLI